MAAWVFGPLLCLLLFIISLQLRAIGKQLVKQNARKPAASDSDAELPLEAWLQELESKGEEILNRIEVERRSVEAANLRLNQRALSEAQVTTSVPVQDLPRTNVSEKNGGREAPPLRQPDEVHVQNWVRQQSTSSVNKEKSSQQQWAKARQRLGQNWEDTQVKVQEMARRGAAAATIARSLGLSQGEVQLILCKSTVPGTDDELEKVTR